MQISGSSPTLNTLRLSLTSESQRAALLGKLSEGQTIQARVVDELSTGRWAIRFMGHTLVAESRLALKPGQVVETRVHDVGPPLLLSISGRPGSEAAAVRTALQQLGLGDDTTNRAIIASLIRNGLPVERAEVQALREFLTGLGNSPLLDNLDELVDRILFLRSKGLPVTPDTIAAFWSTAPSGTLGALLGGLAELLRNIERQGSPPRAGNLVANLLDRISGEISPHDLQAFLADLGLDLEAKLAQGIAPDNLRAALLQLLASPDLTTEQSDQITHLVRFLNTLGAGSLPGSDNDPVFFQIPLPDRGGLATADIRISRGGENGQIDPQRISLSVTVTLSALGSVQIDLASYDAINTCRIRVESQRARELIEAERDTLTEGLSRSGYPVPEIRVQLDAVEPPPESSPRLGVDFKA